MFRTCEVLASFLRLLNILITLCFWNNGFFLCKGFLTAIDASLQIELEKSSRTFRGWVNFICIKSVICKLELALFRDGQKKQIRWITLQVSSFLWLCRMLRKTALEILLFDIDSADIVPPAVTAFLISKSQTFSSLGTVKLEEGWKEVLQGIACSSCCWIVPFPVSLLLPCFCTLASCNSIKPHEYDSSLETRICPIWILLGKRRNNSMSKCKSGLS